MLNPKSFPEFQSLTDEQSRHASCRFIDASRTVAESPSSETDSIISTIFAPDPVTGNPRSDLAYIMSNDKRPEVAAFIRDTLMQPLGGSSGIDDPDFALETVKSSSESLSTYADRLRSILNPEKK